MWSSRVERHLRSAVADTAAPVRHPEAARRRARGAHARQDAPGLRGVEVAHEDDLRRPVLDRGDRERPGPLRKRPRSASGFGARALRDEDRDGRQLVCASLGRTAPENHVAARADAVGIVEHRRQDVRRRRVVRRERRALPSDRASGRPSKVTDDAVRASRRGCSPTSGARRRLAPAASRSSTISTSAGGRGRLIHWRARPTSSPCASKARATSSCGSNSVPKSTSSVQGAFVEAPDGPAVELEGDRRDRVADDHRDGPRRRPSGRGRETRRRSWARDRAGARPGV